ncbi:MAG: hypothetical protein QOC92_2324 [Acidimicrobiaceae bacterium]
MDDDRTLIASVAARIAVPKAAAADSFVLHAPLELLARAALLPHVSIAARTAARERLRWLADQYDAAGDPVDEPAPMDVASVEDGAIRLTVALDAGELDDVDRLAQWLGWHTTASELRYLLAEPVAASLAAAAHASILLYLLPRVAGVPGSLLRGPARELARYPDWRLRWFEDPDEIVTGAGTLAEALLDVPMLGLPGSNFIFPIMNQAEESGIAAKLLGGLTGLDVDVRAATRDLSRIAAWSMLQEPPEHAPYGWSHCLTMPQAVMALAGHGAEPRTAVAVAATHVVGFRAALGEHPLAADYEPDAPTTSDVGDAITSGRDDAASTVWHAPASALDDIVTELATRAALHHDAHLVKYTLACLDAATADPTHRRLYLSAAASLSSWWAQQPTDGFLD